MNTSRITSCSVALALVAFSSNTLASDEKSIKNFAAAIAALSPTVDPAEAQLLSATAHQTARQCAKDYRLVWPPSFHNLLIHLGIRQRGYCYHYSYDIGTRLRQIPFKTLELHWGASDENTQLESNCLVVTARGQAFHEGYIMDAWRMAGHLVWWPAKSDSAFHWRENPKLTAWLQHQDPQKVKAPAKTAAR